MPFKVNDSHRKNELSFVEGGYAVTVTHESGKTVVYDKVHFPIKYSETILGRTHRDGIIQIKIGEEVYWKV